MILRLESEITNVIGRRDSNQTLGMRILKENLLTQAINPAAKTGKTGISPILAKTLLKDTKVIARRLPTNIKNKSFVSLEFFSNIFSGFLNKWFVTH